MAVKKAKTVTEQAFQIPAPDIRLMGVCIKGTAPLIFHKWSEKAIKMILDKQLKKATKGREVRNPEQEYVDSFYYNADGFVAFPALNIKQSIVGSGRFVNDVPMTILRGCVFVKGDKDGMIPVLVNNKPIKISALADSGKVQGIAAVDKKTEEVAMRQDMVTVGNGAADIRFRGQISDWEMQFPIEYNANLLSAEQVLNLLQYAGFSQGLGEWRPEKNGNNGTFTVVSTSERPQK